MSPTRQQRLNDRVLRKGMATLEVVMATAIGFPILAIMAYFGIFACRVLFSVIGSMVGSPLL